MTSIKSNLLLMRTEWYNAFYNANIEQLDYLETEWFMSTNGQKIIYKKHQLRKLALLASERKKVIVKRSEFNIEIREFQNIACITGSATIEEDDYIVHTNFIENWIKLNNGWKIQFVSFESK